MGKVLWCEIESSQGLNLERAKVLGLPIEKILHPLSDPLADVDLQNPQHWGAIKRMAGRPDVKIVMVDSLSGGNSADENKPFKMLPILKQFAELAKNTGTPNMVSHHLRKKGSLDVGNEGVTLEMLRGTKAITQVARVVWATDIPEPKSEKRRLSMIKDNIVNYSAIDPLGFLIRDDGVEFMEAPKPPGPDTHQDRIAAALRDLLSKGPVPTVEIGKVIKSKGLSIDIANRMKTKLGIKSFKKGGVWFWKKENED